MGSGNWFRTIIIRKRLKEDSSKQKKSESTAAETNGTQEVDKESIALANGSRRCNTMLSEDLAARRIQSSLKEYLARKSVGDLKGEARCQGATKPLAAEYQQSSALKLIHFWAKIQAEIKASRMCMVTESKINQKKLENKLKLDAKLHEAEVEWCAGSETMEEILQRIQHREEATVKRERAMAYAFSHQWRANSSQHFGRAYYDLGKDSWGWSWKERWVAGRPWEVRAQTKSTNSKNNQSRQANKGGKTPNHAAISLILTVKPRLPNGKDKEPRKLVNHMAQRSAA